MPYDDPLNFWHHLIIRWDGERLDYYIDNQIKWQQTPPGNPLAIDVERRLALCQNGFYMDDLRIYSRVFDEREQCEMIIEGEWAQDTCVMPPQ